MSVLLCLTFLLSISHAGTPAIEGFVHYGNGEPAAGIIVLTDDGRACPTDEEGWYSIPVEPGIYDIHTGTDGCLRSGRSGVPVMEDEATRVDLVLPDTGVSAFSVSPGGSSLDGPPVALRVADGPEDLLEDEPGVLDSRPRNGSLKFLGGGFYKPLYQLSTMDSFLDNSLHMRGGRRGEILYTVDGRVMTEPVSRTFIGTLPLSSIESMETLTGVYDARYGNFLSGVVRMETPEGGEDYEGEIRTGFNDWHALGLGEAGTWGGYTDAEHPWKTWQWGSVTPFNDARLEFGGSVGGPEPLTAYILPQIGLGIPGELGMFIDGEYTRTGGGKDNRYGWGFDDWSENYTGLFKLSYRPGQATEIGLSTSFTERSSGWFRIGDYWSWSRYEEPWVLEEDTLSPGGDILYALPTRTWSNRQAGIRIDHALGEFTSISAGFTQVKADYLHRVYNDPASTDPMRQTEWLGEDWDWNDWQGYVPGIEMDPDGFVREGTSRFPWMEQRSTTNSVDLRTETFAWGRHDISWGLRADFQDVYGYTVIVDEDALVHQNRFDESPFSGGVYLQDRLEFQDGMLLTGGLRLEYFDANYGPAPEPLETPPPPTLQNRVLDFVEAPPKYSLNPRFSFEMPITGRQSMHAAYGMYSQVPQLRYLYHGEDNSYSEQIPLGGNPDLELQRTTQYEIGLTHAFTDRLSLAATGYFREMSNLVETDFFSHPGVGQYAQFTSSGTGESRGLEVALLGSGTGFLSWDASYCLSRATGSSSHPLQDYLYHLSGYQNSDEGQYLDWDRRHTLNLFLAMEVPRGRGLRIGGVRVMQGLGIGLEWEYGSGFPYTHDDQDEYVEPNTRRYPATSTADLRVRKKFWLGSFSMDIRLEVTNLFNRHDTVDIQDIAWYHADEFAGGKGNRYDHDPTGPMNNYYAFSAPRFVRFGLGLYW